MKQAPKQANRYPTSFQTTDIVLYKFGPLAKMQVTLGRKKRKRKFRFPGGFVDPSDLSLEGAAFREMTEECDKKKTLTTGPVNYRFSLRIDDPRYRKSVDKILSAVHTVMLIGGEPTAGDDLKEVRWFDADYIKANYKTFMVKEHWPIVRGLVERGLL